jgi:filamentous hemagglutinin family protein
MASAAALALAVAPPVAAQVALPGAGTIGTGTVQWQYSNGSPGGGGFSPDAAIVRPNGNNIDTLTMRIGTPGAVIEWGSFSIGREGGTVGTVDFINAPGFSDPFAVLNRVTGTSASQIDGILRGNGNGANGGSIWVINPNGVVFGPRASVTNMAGFVASTLGVSNPEFNKFVNGGAFGGVDGVAFTHVAGSGGNAGIVRMEAGASGPANGAAITNIDGVVLLVARRVDMQAAADPARNPTIAAGGDVGFVVAREASVRLTQNSLLQMAVTQGSDLAEGRLIAGGVVQGAQVFAAVANRTTLVGNLLNVSGAITATHAVATEKGIVLRAGTDAAGTVPICPTWVLKMRSTRRPSRARSLLPAAGSTLPATVRWRSAG